jgi:O-Antigen ligase
VREPQVSRAATAGRRRRPAQLPRLLAQIDAVAPPLFTALAIGLIAKNQGGYFPTSWGWSTLALLAVVATWLVAGPRTDLGRFDVWFLLALLLVTSWVGLSITWSVDRAQSVLEFERSLVLASGCGAFLLLSRRRAAPSLALGIVAAITAVCAYSLWTRLFPSATGFDPSDPTSVYRLFEPVGYWNALGAFSVIGILLALGILTESALRPAQRAFAGLAVVVLPVTLFFTFSRASWLALACGLLVAIAASPHRLRLIAEGTVFAIVPAVAVLLASRSSGLTDRDATLASASHQGHHFALILVGFTAVSVVLVLALVWVEERATIGRRARHTIGSILFASAAVVLVAAVTTAGSPVSLAKRGYDSFVATKPPTDPMNMSGRLLSLNGNGRARMWRVAIDSVHGHWLGGTGAGSFERNWDRSPKANDVIRDAHGLYVETLSELGIVGLLLLVVTVSVPLIAGLRVRRVPIAPAATGAYAAFLLHNAVDWDWELSGITLTGLLAGCVLLVIHREGVERHVARSVRFPAGVGVVVVGGFALIAAIGNGALANAQTANQAHEYATAASDASIARRWMPWSSEPLKALGEARLGQRDVSAARASFLKATSIDPGDWQAWLDLAASLGGDERARAVAHARRLYPTSPEIAEFEMDSQRTGR